MRGRTRGSWARKTFAFETAAWRAVSDFPGIVNLFFYCSSPNAFACKDCARGEACGELFVDPSGQRHGRMFVIFVRPDGSWQVQAPCSEAWRRRIQSAITRLSQAYPPPERPLPEEKDDHRSTSQPQGAEGGASEASGGDDRREEAPASGETPGASSEGREGAARGAQEPEDLSGVPCPAASAGASGAREEDRGSRAGSGSLEGESGGEPSGSADPHHSRRSGDAPESAPALSGEATRGDPPPLPAELPREEGEGEGGEGGAREEGTVPSPGGARPEAPEPPEQGGNIRELLKEFREASRAIRKSASGGSQGSLSLRARERWGGVTAIARGVQPDPRVVSLLQQILNSIRMGGEAEEGPRLDHAKTATKLAGYLRPITMADRRLEEGRPALLVLPDVSGSMNFVSRDVLAAGLAIARTGASGWDVAVVSHSNGFPVEIVINSSSPEKFSFSESREEQIEALRIYERLISTYQIRVVLICADWDGEWLYRRLAANPHIERVIWLDPWSCSRLRPRHVPFPPRHAGSLSGWTPESIRKVRYAFAVGNATDVAEALQQILRKGGL